MVLMAFCASALAVNVRGRVDFQGAGGRFPMNQALVEMCQESNNCMTYRTGNDGMYYFNASPGKHYIRVNGTVKWRLDVPNVLSLDIPALVGN
jgi:hypothetical protein